MLAFTLSKMNLLILVTALFAIIAYFMFGLTDIIIANSANQIVSAKAQQALSIVNSDKMCFLETINMPSAITYFGESQRFFYAMKISRFPETTQTGKNNTLIFSIVNRKKPDKIIAAKSIDVDAEIILFGIEPTTFTLKPNPESSITIDPQAATPVNSFRLIKEVYDGKKYLYVIACAFGSGGGISITCRQILLTNPNAVGCQECKSDSTSSNCDQTIFSSSGSSICDDFMNQVSEKINDNGIIVDGTTIVPKHTSICFRP